MNRRRHFDTVTSETPSRHAIDDIGHLLGEYVLKARLALAASKFG
jgi:hypothetical protein